MAAPRAWRPAEEAFTNLVLQKSVVSFSTILRRSKYELVGSDEVLSSKTKLCIESGQFGIDFICRIASFFLEMFSRGFSRRTAWRPYVQRCIRVVGVPPRLAFRLDAGRIVGLVVAVVRHRLSFSLGGCLALPLLICVEQAAKFLWQ